MAEEEGSALRSILAFFHIAVDDSELKEGHKSVEGFLGKLKEATKVVAEVFAVHEIKEFVEEQVSAAVALKTTAARLGVTTEDVETFHLAAREAGVGVAAMDTSLRFLNRNIANAKAGTGPAAAEFSKLHIAVKDANGQARPAADVMADLADKVAAVQDPAEKTKIAMTLLGRGGASLIPLLNKGGEAFKAVREEMEELGGYTSEEFIEASHEAEIAQIKLDVVMGNLKQHIVEGLLPAFTTLYRWAKDIVAPFLTFLKTTVAVNSAVAFFGTFAAVKAVSGLKSILSVLGVLQPTIGGTVKALLGFAAPVLVVGALYLVFDDLYTLLHGGESVIGDTIDHFLGVGQAAIFAKDFNDALESTIDILVDVGKVIGNALMIPLQTVWTLIGAIRDALSALAHGDISGAAKAINVDAKINADVRNRTDKLGEAAGDLGADFSLNAEGRRLRKKGRLGTQTGGFGAAGAAAVAAVGPKNIYGDNLGPLYVPKGAGKATEAAAAGTVIKQHNETHIDIKTSSNEPDKIGKAVGQSVATAYQRNMAKASIQANKP